MAKAAVAKPAAKITMSAPALKMVHIEQGNARDAIKAAGATNKTIQLVPLDKLAVLPGFNVRVDNEEHREGLLELRDSIALEGYYPSSVLSVIASKDSSGDDVIYITDGHRRFNAVRMANEEGAGITALPVVFEAANTSMLDLTSALAKKNSGRGLSMLEQGIIAKRMLDAKLSVEETAARLGKSTRHVNDLMTLINAPRAVRDMVKSGLISATDAIKQVRKAPEEAVEKLKAMAEKAQEAGEKRITRTSSVDQQMGAAALPPGVKMVTVRHEVLLGIGDTVGADTVEQFRAIIGDDDWFKQGTRKNELIVTEPIEVRVAVRRPKKTVPEATSDDVEVEEAEAEVEAPRKAGRKANGGTTPPVPVAKPGRKPAAKKAPVEELEDEDEEMQEGDDDDDDDDAVEAPDLEAEDVGDPL